MHHHCMGTNQMMKPEGCFPVKSDGELHIASQKQLEVHAQCRKQDNSSPFKSSLTTSPAASLSNSYSFASTSSDSSVDLNWDKRDDRVVRGAESGLGDCGDAQNGLKTLNSMVPIVAHENSDIPLNSDYKGENHETFEIKTNVDNNTLGFSGVETKVLHLFEDATDAEIWMPPPTEKDDDLYNLDDDDDECGDGEWGTPSSLSGFGDADGSSRSCCFREEEEKAMKEVRNGKFRTLVSQLLKTAGIFDLEKDRESWVDIVSNLAWGAALFVNRDAAEANVMDPTGYVKVKCIATGSRSQSQLIKGLVFKKHAAHKRMPTRYTKPRILLIQGMLESSGLSSFNSMIPQDKDNVQKDSIGQDIKSFIENLEASHPDVVFVEKSAPRDVLEAMLKMGVTLVADMKLHRLERIAHFTGSPILSADVNLNQKLNQCEMLYFEKYVEEHAQVVEGAKKPSKTLMFLVGSSTNRGCTILLKGSHSEELKKIKCVIPYAVVMACHFILETSFLINQELMFSTIVSDGVASRGDRELSDINTRISQSVEFPLESASADGTNLSESSDAHEEHLVESSSNYGCSSRSLESYSSVKPPLVSQPVDIPISSSFSEESLQVEVCVPSDGVDIPISNGFHEGGNQQLSSQSQYKNVLQPILQLVDKSSLSPNSVAPVLFGSEPSGNSDDEKLLDSDNNSQPSITEATSDVRKAVPDIENCDGRREAIDAMFDSESILVLMSSRNASRETICEQSHFSHIKFYKNFDVPLGRFLRKNLFNQNTSCKACGQLPEAHFYHFAHHNLQLTIRVKRIPGKKSLPGESEGRLWMWSRCGICKPGKESNKSTTRRVLITRAARCLSFGKFLELSFKNHSSFNRLSNCGHSLYRDFLYFFGLGNSVSMFRYSNAVTYCVAVPPQKLEFNNPIKKEWLENEMKNVYTRAMSLFTEVASYLSKIGSRLSSSKLNLNGSAKELCDIEKMLEVEKSEFEENIRNACIKSGEPVRKHLHLNRLRWELLLEACMWNRRLQLVLSSGFPASNASVSSMTVEEKPNLDQCADGESKAASPAPFTGSSHAVFNDKISVNHSDVEVQTECVSAHSESSAMDYQFELQEDGTSSITIDGIPRPMLSDQDSIGPADASIGHFKTDVNQTENTTTSDQVLTEIPISEDLGENKISACKSLPNIDASTPSSPYQNFEGQWIWNPFSEIRDKCFIDLRNKGQLLTFQDCLRYDPLRSPEYLRTISQIITEEGSRMHVPFCIEEYILSDYESEISSIIACALAMMGDFPQQTENHSERDDTQSVRTSVTTDESVILSRATSEPPPLCSSTSASFQSDAIHIPSSLSLAESRLSSFDGLNLLDSLMSFGARHPDIVLGMDKVSGKGKYTVVCVHVNEFRNLRKRCCPSEIDYIASLSRCKIWDAKGGKSKSLFAKTLDDRLIIKEIKRTEFDSFIKFAPAYFHHMEQAFESGNQTCLAKILGIYQVTVRQLKSGKEVKHDLMVMENLSFGRNITRQYDLKGALHARFTEISDSPGDVLLDQNFVNDMNTSPLYVVQKAKRLLQRAVWNDTTFLNSINVMDYSLLVGVDRDRKELVCGIIDYLRQYTWDKQLETWVKASLVVPKNVLPTVISPKEYKKRFRKFMDTHFLTVPDCWHSQTSSVPCNLCGVGADHPLQPRTENEERRV
ncbi:hypothetical protein V2J09_000781 [Rumex salicifolius]